MTGRSLSPYQQAIYGVLSTDAALATLVSAVHDHVPQQATLPYLVFTSIASRSEEGIVTRYERVTLGIHAYSQGAGRKESEAIVARVSELLHRQKPALSSAGEIVWQRVTRAGATRMADGRTWRGDVELTAMIELEE